MLKESLKEYLHAAEYCINYRKGISWPSGQAGGCLGYPGTALMFCILDTIGSYHRGRKDFMVPIDGKNRVINNKSHHHFFMLNSEYYEQSLEENSIKKLYDNYRNLLLHNATLAANHILFMGAPNGPPFPISKSRPHINVTAFLEITKAAVALFLKNINEVLNKSNQVKVIEMKR